MNMPAKNVKRKSWWLGLGLMILAVLGYLASRFLWDSHYRAFEEPARVVALVAAATGMVAACLLAGANWRPVLRVLFVVVCSGPLVVLALALQGNTRDYFTIHPSQYAMGSILKATEIYRADNGGFFPYDERGSSESLSLLYPKYIILPQVFVDPVIAGQWHRRNDGPFFPDGTSLAGEKCHFAYTWHVPPNPPFNFAIISSLPDTYIEDGKISGFEVGYADGSIKWQTTAFCSHDPNDNIFAPEAGWREDTDSFMR